MKSLDEMIRVNRVQAEFYDSIHEAERSVERGGYAKNKASNALTRVWATLRYRQQDAVREAGVEQLELSAHRRWVESKRGGSFLEIGCFSGSRLTLHLAEVCGSYLGVDLSSKAIASLNNTLMKNGLGTRARAQALDLLTMSEECQFDCIYSHGVLHHFENPVLLMEKLTRLLKPDGILVFAEPSACNRVYRLLRGLYRPFQSDKAWEWPFTPATVASLEERFEVTDGFGWGRSSLLLSILTGLPVAGGWVRKLYLRQVKREVSEGWSEVVWKNSYVAAVARVRASTGRR